MNRTTDEVEIEQNEQNPECFCAQCIAIRALQEKKNSMIKSPNPKAEFPKRLFEARRKCRWTQKELAKVSGVLEIRIRSYERGNEFPTLDTLVRLADWLDVTTDHLLGRTNP